LHFSRSCKSFADETAATALVAIDPDAPVRWNTAAADALCLALSVYGGAEADCRSVEERVCAPVVESQSTPAKGKGAQPESERGEPGQATADQTSGR